jgi:hypothetical protein
VAWATGLSEGHTIIRSRDLLVETYFLARRDGQKLYALPPKGLEHWWQIDPPVEDWDRTGDWQRRLWTWPMYLPAQDNPAKLDLHDCVLLGLLLSLEKDHRIRRLTYQGLRTMTGMHPGTIKKSLAKLTRLGFVADIASSNPAFFALGVYRPKPRHLALFQDVIPLDDFDPGSAPDPIFEEPVADQEHGPAPMGRHGRRDEPHSISAGDPPGPAGVDHDVAIHPDGGDGAASNGLEDRLRGLGAKPEVVELVVDRSRKGVPGCDPSTLLELLDKANGRLEVFQGLLLKRMQEHKLLRHVAESLS